MEEGGLRNLFPASLIFFSNSLFFCSFSSSLSKEVIFSSDLEAQNSETQRLKLCFLCMFFLFFLNGVVGLGKCWVKVGLVISLFFCGLGLVCFFYNENWVL